MPTPVAHSLAGFAAAKLTSQKGNPFPLYLVAAAVVMGNLPDLDFLPGLLIGKPAMFHSGISHSLGFGLGASLLAAGLVAVKNKSFWLNFALFFTAYMSHVLLDFFNPDGRPPYGVPAFWPLTETYFISPVSLFLGVYHVGSASGTTAEFVRGVLNVHNVYAMAVETLVMAPFVLLGLWRQRKARKLSQPARVPDNSTPAETRLEKGNG